jgi:secreted trypsin-like serine protease
MQWKHLFLTAIMASLPACAAESTPEQDDGQSEPGEGTENPNDFAVDVDESAIAGGANLAIAGAPWQAIWLGKDDLCGASILSASWIVTAAHCSVAKNDFVGAGAANLNDIKTKGQLVHVTKVVKHPKYNPNAPINDIQLVQVSPPFKLSGPNVKAIRYARATDAALVAPGAAVMMSGWGLKKEDGTPPAPSLLLQGLTMRVSTPKAVADAFGPTFNSPLLLGTFKAKAGACPGDSGGPVAATKVLPNKTKERVLVGVVAGGSSPCQAGEVPSLSARVSQYAAWIAKVMKP